MGGLVLFALACRELGAPFIASGGIVSSKLDFPNKPDKPSKINDQSQLGYRYSTCGGFGTGRGWYQHGNAIYGNC